MMQAPIKSIADLFVAGNKASTGAGAHGLTLELTVGTKVLIDADLELFSLAYEAHLAAKADAATSRTLLRTKRKGIYDFNFAARDSLKRSLGRKYSSAWDGSGFTNSLAVPRSMARLQLVTRSLQSYLVDHPALEVPDAVTAVLAQAALDDVTNAQSAVDLQKSVVGTLLTARKQKEKQLRLRLRWLIDELTRVMSPLDDRWTAFGLNRPGLQQTPDRPDKVSVILTGLDAGVKWKKTPRAEYYRIWLKVIGVHTEPVVAGSPADLNFTIPSLPAASQIEVSVSAVNNGGESVRSAVVIVTTP